MEKKKRPINLVKSRWMKIPMPDNQIVKKFYNGGKVDSIDIQLLWRYMYYQIFMKITPNRPFEISEVLTMKTTRIHYGKRNKRYINLRRGHYYSISIVIEPKIVKQYTDFLNGGDYVVFPKDIKISDWAIDRIMLRSWFSRRFINKYIIKFFEEAIFRVPLMSQFKFNDIILYPIQRKNRINDLMLNKKEYPKLALLRFVNSKWFHEDYTNEIISNSEKKILR